MPELMTSSAAHEVDRWAGFTPDEQELIRYSLTANADFLEEDVRGGEVDAPSVEAALTAATAARSLADEIAA